MQKGVEMKNWVIFDPGADIYDGINEFNYPILGKEITKYLKRTQKRNTHK